MVVCLVRHAAMLSDVVVAATTILETIVPEVLKKLTA
jgi:hypothetical protein